MQMTSVAVSGSERANNHCMIKIVGVSATVQTTLLNIVDGYAYHQKR